MWFFFALAAATFYSLRRFSEKRLSGRAHHFTLGWAVQALSLPVVIVFAAFAPIPAWSSLSSRFWVPLLIIWFFLYPAQAYFYYQSLKRSDASNVLPLMSFVPIFTVVLSFVLSHQFPSLIGLCGIASIVAGVYVLNLKPGQNAVSPILFLFRDTPSRFMLITSMVVALGTSLDKVAVTASNPLFYSFVNTLGGAIVLTAIAWLTNPKFFQDVRVNARQLGLLGMFQGFGVTAYMLAIGTGLAAYVIAIKNANVVVGAVLGLVFLRESFSKQKVGSFGLIIIGLGLIAVG